MPAPLAPLSKPLTYLMIPPKINTLSAWNLPFGFCMWLHLQALSHQRQLKIFNCSLKKREKVSDRLQHAPLWENKFLWRFFLFIHLIWFCEYKINKIKKRKRKGGQFLASISSTLEHGDSKTRSKQSTGWCTSCKIRLDQNLGQILGLMPSPWISIFLTERSSHYIPCSLTRTSQLDCPALPRLNNVVTVQTQNNVMQGQTQN